MAWAFTIHKAQGRSFPRVMVHLNGVFAHGSGKSIGQLLDVTV
jgi:hypothetical protein